MQVGNGRVRFLEVDGVRIISIDLGVRDGQAVLETLAEAAILIQSEPPKSARICTDLRQLGAALRSPSGRYDRALVDGVKSYVIHNAPHVLATAIIVGADETERVFVTFLERFSGRHFEVFESREPAIAWLVSQQP